MERDICCQRYATFICYSPEVYIEGKNGGKPWQGIGYRHSAKLRETDRSVNGLKQAGYRTSSLFLLVFPDICNLSFIEFVSAANAIIIYGQLSINEECIAICCCGSATYAFGSDYL